MSSWQGSGNRLADKGTTNEVPKSGILKLRRVFKTVRLLVRVMRSWPQHPDSSDDAEYEDDDNSDGRSLVKITSQKFLLCLS